MSPNLLITIMCILGGCYLGPPIAVLTKHYIPAVWRIVFSVTLLCIAPLWMLACITLLPAYAAQPYWLSHAILIVVTAWLCYFGMLSLYPYDPRKDQARKKWQEQQEAQAQTAESEVLSPLAIEQRNFFSATGVLLGLSGYLIVKGSPEGVREIMLYSALFCGLILLFVAVTHAYKKNVTKGPDYGVVSVIKWLGVALLCGSFFF